jgi:tetratricopeptide (TPR) repeat protein
MARQRELRRRSPPPRTSPESPLDVGWRAVIIILTALLAYANSLSGPFIFDDFISIVDNQQIREWWNFATVLFPRRELPTAGRPLVNFSFAVNYAVGGLDVRGYHLVNLAFHLLSGLLVFGIVRRTLELPSLKDRFTGTALNAGSPARGLCALGCNLGFAAALLWTLHPVNTEAVNYLTQRTELMMALFYLLTLYASIRAVASRGRPWGAIAVLSCIAGMACKESMVTAPVVVMLYDVIFVFESPRKAISERWRFYAALCMSWVVLAALVWSGPRVHTAGFSTGVSPWTYLLNQTVMITRYLHLALWPRALVVNYGWPVPLALGDVLPYALFVTALLALTAVALIRWPKWGFFGAWFFVTLAPTSSIVPIATEVGAERRMYLPLIAIVVLAVVSASFLKRAVSAAGAVALAVVAALFSIGIFARNREYASELLLARTIVERHPTSVAHHVLGVTLLIAGDHDAAMSELRQAIPGAPRAHYTLGVELVKEGRTSEAIDQFQAFLREQPNLVEAISARQLLGRALAQQQRWSEAIEQEQQVLTMNPSDAQRLDTHALLAEAFFGAENFQEAIAHCLEYLRFRPNDGRVLTRLGIALIATGRLDEAIAAFRRAAAAAPTDADAQRNLASALHDHRDFQEGVVYAQRALALRPADAQTHHLLGRLLALLGRFDEARTHFDRALQIDQANTDAKEDLRKLQAVIGR